MSFSFHTSAQTLAGVRYPGQAANVCTSADVCAAPVRAKNVCAHSWLGSGNRAQDRRGGRATRRTRGGALHPCPPDIRIAYVKLAALAGIFDGDHLGVALTRPVRSGVRNASAQRSRAASLYGRGGSLIALCGLSLGRTTRRDHTANHSAWKLDVVAYLAGRLYRFRVAQQQPKGRYFLHKLQCASGRCLSRATCYFPTDSVGSRTLSLLARGLRTSGGEVATSAQEHPAVGVEGSAM